MTSEIRCKTHLRSPATQSARVLPIAPSSFRGRRECRAPDAPAAACAGGRKQKAHALVRSHRKHPAFPAQWFTTYFVLSPVTGLFCHRHQWRLRHQLDTSVGVSGPHDFAVRSGIVRPCTCVHRHRRVHRIPHPTSVTTAKRPSCERGMARVLLMLLSAAETIYFCEEDWTAKI